MRRQRPLPSSPSSSSSKRGIMTVALQPSSDVAGSSGSMQSCNRLWAAHCMRENPLLAGRATGEAVSSADSDQYASSALEERAGAILSPTGGCFSASGADAAVGSTGSKPLMVALYASQAASHLVQGLNQTVLSASYSPGSSSNGIVGVLMDAIVASGCNLSDDADARRIDEASQSSG